MTRGLRALVRRPTLTKLILRSVCLGRDGVRLLCMTLCSISSF
jgi:hypothetical protein